MKRISTLDSVGQVLCHDITQIVKNVNKDAVFRKGHVIQQEDIPVLLSIGKENIYIWENDDSMLHENDAAEILKNACIGPNMHATEPKEGKIELIADVDGLMIIDLQKLHAINGMGDVMIASKHSGFTVKKGEVLCGTRVVPLVIEKSKMESVKIIGGYQPIFQIIPFKSKKFGLVTTGSEVFHHRIEDTFTPVIQEKLAEFGGSMVSHVVVDDDDQKVTAAIEMMLDEGVDMVICTGGMSVDPDDKTPLAIKNSRARIVSYGAPVLPGAMFLLAYTDDKRPVIGLPGCVMYAKRTIFDLVLPRLIADVNITVDDLQHLGEGGLCQNCQVCRFPNCSFGK